VAWEEGYKNPSGDMSKVGNEVREIKDQLALLLAAAGIGKVEEVKRAERIKAQRTAELKEEKMKMEERRKLAKFAKVAEAERKVKEDSENKKALELAEQIKAIMEKEEALVRECKPEITTLVNTDKNTLSLKEIIRLGQRMKNAK